MAGWLLCSLRSALILVLVSADQLKKTEGENVTLPCKLPSSNLVIVLQWSRTDLGSEYVLRFRDEQIDSSNQHQSFKNRVDLKDTNMEDGDVSLVLKDLRTEDGGTYECRVLQRGTGSNRMKLISTISLEVEALPPGRYEKLKADQPDQNEDDQHSETAEKNRGTQETPAPPSTTESNPGVFYSTVNRQDTSYGEIVINHKKDKTNNREEDSAVINSDVRTEDISYGQIVIRKNRNRELQPEPDTIYSSLRNSEQ